MYTKLFVLFVWNWFAAQADSDTYQWNIFDEKASMVDVTNEYITHVPIVFYWIVPTPLAAKELGTAFRLRNNFPHRAGPQPTASTTSSMGNRIHSV